MIKKILKSVLSLGIIILGIINFSNANSYLIGTEYASGSSVESGFNLKYVYLNTQTNATITEPFFAFKSSTNTVFTKYWWQSDGLYYSKQNYGNTQKKNGKILGYFICPATYFESSTTYNKYLKDVSGCTYTTGYDGINTYLQGLTNWNYTFNTTADNNWSIVCAKKDGNENKVCFDMSYVSVLESTDLTYANIRERATINPFYSDLSTPEEENSIPGIELESSESVINYFESRYGRDSSICYVGINNSTDLWGSSVVYNEGSGLTIFQLYDQLYGTGDLNHYYVFVNNWLLNYEQWFNTNGNPLYLSNYNSGSNQVELYYDNLSFPFANNPIAVYFMSNNISLKSPGSTMGSEVVSYCQVKINNGTFEDVIDQSVKNNITKYTEQENKSDGYNSDGTVRHIDIGEFKLNTGSWTDYGDFVTGSFTSEFGITYNTGFNEVTSGFAEMFSGLDNLFAEMWDYQNAYTGLLPSYIVFAFLFIVLFKIIRR